MPKEIIYEGKTHVFPDDFTDDDIAAALSEQQAPGPDERFHQMMGDAYERNKGPMAAGSALGMAVTAGPIAGPVAGLLGRLVIPAVGAYEGYAAGKSLAGAPGGVVGAMIGAAGGGTLRSQLPKILRGSRGAIRSAPKAAEAASEVADTGRKFILTPEEIKRLDVLKKLASEQGIRTAAEGAKGFLR